MSLHDVTIPVFVKYLRNLDRWIEKAQVHAQRKKFDPEILLQARLAPDQFPLLQQVQAACDASKYTAAKLAGKEPPAHPDVEKTIDEVRARIRTAVAYVESVKREELEGADERAVTHTWMQGKHMRGSDYVNEFALPNFLFHITTAYAILRHNGVELGKMDFIGGLSLK